MDKIYLKKNSNFSEVNIFFIKTNGAWSSVTQEQLLTHLRQNATFYGGEVTSVRFEIAAPSTVTAETCQCLAIYDTSAVTSGVVWTIVSGSTYASIDNTGLLTINSNANESEIVITASYSNRTASHSLIATYKSGSTSETTTEVVVDEEGNSTTVTTTVTENEDGSSYIEQNTVITDESGNTIGTSETTITNNADGSMTGQTTNYNADGEPTDGTNVSGDTSGNVSTQSVEYDESGNTTVTGYNIDTSDNPNGSKTMNGDGVNTEYYAFDVTRGFIVDMAFTVDFSNKPTGQNENHHNILTAKRASPSPWYGFQLRQSSTNQYIQLGTQFSTGSNTNTRIDPISKTGNTGEYNLRIIYDPTKDTDSFVCINMADDSVVYTSNGKFPDIEDLKYIKVTIGYAMDENGDPFRYSCINVKNFNIRRISYVEAPVISCDGENVTITCETEGAAIYYRLNEIGTYIRYTSPIAISANTIVEAYSEFDVDKSEIVKQTCIYDNGVIPPVISCDGENVEITCEMQGASIYYRLNETGEYTLYTSGFTISANTVVEAYSELNSKRSAIITENCIYNPDMDYSLEYLTFRVISGGTIAWNSVGNGYAKTIQYSINDGVWIPITSTSEPATISVSEGDVVRFKGTNSTYGGSNTDYSGFAGGTALFDVEGNIMSLIYGDNFVGNTALTGSYNFCSLFKQTNVISAENLILPATTLTPYCYRALFANSPSLTVAPELPAMTLAEGCYRYMFQDAAITTAPDLLAPILVTDCYEGMFDDCHNLNYIRCLATDISAVSATTGWTQAVASRGTFVKDVNTEWPRGANGIPTNWTVVDEGLSKPTIDCDGLEITITCSTQGASIYYRLNEEGEYVQYSSPIAITADTIVQAYSQLSGETSDIVRASCIYDDGIIEPIIYCDGEYITISCDTGGAYIFYKLDDAATYTQYESAIVITADTVCYAYSEIDGRQSEVVSATCIYDESLKTPNIECDGTSVTITCNSVGADIYYKLNDDLIYTLYSSPITITADTVVYAYSQLDGETSAVVSETCVYNPYHDYSKDYLTFDILTNGTIAWDSIGTGYNRTIQYSKNNGAWTTITASSATTISVSAGDSVRFKGTNATYAKDKSNYSGFDSGGTATFNISGNIMSLVYGDNFENNTGLTGTYNFCSLFKLSRCISAENLVLPSTTLTNYCYRAMFSKCSDLITAPSLPATTLSRGCYYYMFEECAITSAPELLAEALVQECYFAMFTGCTSLNYIKCMAITGFTTSQCKQNWTSGVAPSGTFVKDASVTTTTWGRGANGIPNGWLIYDDVAVMPPVITYDGEYVTITCETTGATIYYRLNGEGNYLTYSSPIAISADTVVESYAEMNGTESRTVEETCEYVSDIPFEASNRELYNWKYNGQTVETPYSVNRTDGHSSSYAKGTFNFETTFVLKEAQPTYLWFQHADQSASVYIDNNLVEKHWGGYTAFFVDVSEYVHSGSNTVKVALKNNEGNYLAPASGDFNFNATLGNVKLFTSPYIPAMNYGYDGFHVTSDVATSSATIYVKTKVPTGATVECIIDDGDFNFTTSAESSVNEMTFSTTIQNPHLWDGTIDPHLYTITLNIYHDGDLYHSYQRPYGLRFYRYAINENINGETYTGFLLNGHPYLLRGVCMHDDIDGKANALNDNDYETTFDTIQELGCNFIRLAHYPHPKETYDWCDSLGIIVQTEGPCVNKMQSTMPTDYFDHLNGQYDDMVNQHYNHPCIIFWGLSNETTTDDKDFAKEKMNGYISRIKDLDPYRMVGYVMAQSASDPSAYYNNPNADWFGGNIYEGWYSNTNSNNPTTQINTRIRNIITNKSKALAYSEYGCGGTQHCHSDDFMTTTTRGNNPRHDIEYMMWLHEGHIAAIKNFPQLLFTAQWQLFDIAVANRNEGYTVCLDGENATTDDSLRRLNNKGLVERDHVTKKDTFYLYKAWWNTTDIFVHICGKDYEKYDDRVIKCYTNESSALSLYVNGVLIETVNVADNIAEFSSINFYGGDVVTVSGSSSTDTFTFPARDYSDDYFTLLAIEDTTFKFTRNSLDYSVNDGETWTTLPANTNTPTVNAGDKIMFKKNSPSIGSGAGMGTFSSTGKFKAFGNIMSLVYGDNFANQTSLSGKDYIFRALFNSSKLYDASSLMLPATTLSTYCYSNMFSGCSLLTKAPALPATTMQVACYMSMFSGCNSMTEAPVLPATNLANSCYMGMFNACSNITKAPVLPATTLDDNCYNSMFNLCSRLTVAPELPAMTMRNYCYSSMFKYCSSLTTPPVLPATTMANSCYANMFANCGLTTAPVLPATTMALNCYEGMFYNCASLVTPPALPATTLARECYVEMFYNCISITTAPTLPAAQLAGGCYKYMFKACIRLNSITCLAVSGISEENSKEWVYNVALNGTFTGVSGTKWRRGVSSVPSTWSTNVDEFIEPQVSGTLGMYIDDFPGDYIWEDEGYESLDEFLDDYLADPTTFQTNYYEYCEPFEYGNNTYYIWKLLNNPQNGVRYILTNTINIQTLQSHSIEANYQNVTDNTIVITSFDADLNETYDNEDGHFIIIKAFKIGDDGGYQPSGEIGIYIDDFLADNIDSFVEDPINNDCNGYEYTGSAITYDGGTYYLWRNMGAPTSSNHRSSKIYALTSTINYNELNSKSLAYDAANVLEHPIYTHLDSDAATEYAPADDYNIVSVGYTTGLALWVDDNFDYGCDDGGFSDMNAYLTWYLANLDSAGGNYYYYIDEMEYDGDTCYLWYSYASGTYIVTDTNNVATLTSYSIEADYDNVDTRPFVTMLSPDKSAYLHDSADNYSIVKVVSGQPNIMIYVDDRFMYGNDIPLEDWVDDPESNGANYYEYCDEFEYDGDTYYIWVRLDSNNDNVKYVLTESNDYQTLYSQSLESDFGNLSTHPIVAWLDEDLNTQYEQGERMDNIIKVVIP